MPDNINNVNATRNNTTVSNIIFFVGDNLRSQGIISPVVLVVSFITCEDHICYIYVNQILGFANCL